MKKFLRHVVLISGFFGVPFLFASASPMPMFSALSLVPPAEFLATTDLDARDEFNRPVRSSTVRRDFENLWNSHLTQLFILSLTPAKVKMLELLQTNFDRVKHFLSQPWFGLKDKLLALLTSDVFGKSWRLCSNGLLFSPTTFVPMSLSFGFGNNLLSLVLASTRILR